MLCLSAPFYRSQVKSHCLWETSLINFSHCISPEVEFLAVYFVLSHIQMQLLQDFSWGRYFSCLTGLEASPEQKLHFHMHAWVCLPQQQDGQRGWGGLVLSSPGA